ncbi:MAG: DNA repair protein rad2 [Alyxoria varia]|nr:MAG: DNA repair protein rad2 [Alyxoria varia]
MGVTGLWSVVSPCARPVKIETMAKKRCAVDASIWVYQFLKAVRDKEGNQLRNSHVVGFFRRICKLLFFGIKPVFVFDGGAPTLKRQTISGRKSRREGRREDAVRTAGKLLALQMQRRAEDEDQKRRDEAAAPPTTHQAPEREEEEEVPENPVYVDELQMTQQERTQSRKFKKKDQYHLPDLDVPMAEMGGPNDPRVMSLEELQEYARQFETGEDINVYDFSKIDFNSPFFLSLPATDRYNILNAARMRSRLRMGYSKDQLEEMFPDRMAFSRFQVERVRERHELTKRLMQVGTSEDGLFDAENMGRVAGEKGKEYVLVKNEGVEGGWALGVIGNENKDEGKRDKPIDIEEYERRQQQVPEESSSSSQEDEQHDRSEEIMKKRRAFYAAREKEVQPSISHALEKHEKDDNALFVAEDANGRKNQSDESSSDGDSGDEAAQLQIAIAMSMQRVGGKTTDSEKGAASEARGSNTKSVNFAESERVDLTEDKDVMRINGPKGQGGIENDRNYDSDEDQMDFEGALAESRKSKHRPQSRSRPSHPAANDPVESQPKSKPNQSSFGGPLPFEKLDLGSSLLSKKKMAQIEEQNAGGFEKDADQSPRERAVTPPPWFSGDVEKDLEAQKAIELEDRQRESKAEEDAQYEFQSMAELQPKHSPEVVNLDEIHERNNETIEISSSDDEVVETIDKPIPQAPVEDSEVRMGDVADKVRVEPPENPKELAQETQLDQPSKSQSLQPPESDGVSNKAQEQMRVPSTEVSQRISEEPSQRVAQDITLLESDDEPLPWEASDQEDIPAKGQQKLSPVPADRRTESENQQSDRSESPDVYMPTEEVLQSYADRAAPSRAHSDHPAHASNEQEAVIPSTGAADQQIPVEDGVEGQELDSDSEDEELMEQLAMEAEEHARFASNLNNKSHRQNIEEYEAELKALRTQQKKDRRDADEVTQIMISECQQLLKLFGLPYITAPMEAEAQCAELVSLGLVDGIVTDDSDVFLFGGTRVYKNMFNQAKFVECYLASDFEKEFDLTREKLISIAHLLGSDYTEGIPGIGPVTALEILTEFPNRLEDFKTWWTGVQSGAPATEEDRRSPFRKKFRKNSTKLFLPPTFPDQRVKLAYTQPEVDSDPNSFHWGIPDLDGLRSFLMSTIGWNQERTDEVLVPVIKDINQRENEGTQANITHFMCGSVGAGAFAPRVRNEGKSRRMESALEKMAERARARNQEQASARDDEQNRATPESRNADDRGDVPRTGKKRGRGKKPTSRANNPEDENNAGKDISSRKRRRAKK